MDPKPKRDRKRYLTAELPPALYEPLDELRDDLQDDGISLTGRQVIGRDGINLAMLAWLLDQPAERRRELIAAGISSYRAKVGLPA